MKSTFYCAVEMDMQSGSQYQYGVRMLPLYWDSCYYFIVDLFVRKFHLFFLIDDLVALGNIMGLMCCTGYPITRSKSGRCHGFSLIIFPLPPPPLSRTDLLVFILSLLYIYFAMLRRAPCRAL